MPDETVATKDSGILATDRLSLAVLPFTADSSADDRYFSDGVTEDIVTELSRFRELAVVCTSVLPCKYRLIISRSVNAGSCEDGTADQAAAG